MKSHMHLVETIISDDDNYEIVKKLRFPLGAIEVSCPTLERYLLYMYLLTLSQCSQVLWKVALDYRKSNATFSTISTDFFRSIGFFKLKKLKKW